VETEVINREFLESMAERRPFVKRMFAVFISQEPKRIQQIKNALHEEDAEKLRHLTHSLKGGAATIGVERVRDCCLELENVSKSGDLTSAPELMDALEQEMRDAYAFMFNYLAEN